MRAFLLIMVMLLLGLKVQAQTRASLGTIVNNIKAGPLTGNKNLAFGVKNVLQEALQDKGFSLVDRFDADYVIDIEISFFDVEQTKQGVNQALNEIHETSRAMATRQATKKPLMVRKRKTVKIHDQENNSNGKRIIQVVGQNL